MACEPDILSLSKSVGNGFPVAAVVTTAEIAGQVVSKGLWNLSSHQSDPVPAAAVGAVIDIVREENLLDRARENGEYFLSLLRDLSSRQPAITGVRGQGLMIGFDLAIPASADVADVVNAFMYGCRRRGVHLTYGYGYGNVNFRIIPPLVITKPEIDFAMEVMEQTTAEALSHPGSKAALPRNPYTRPLIEKHPWRRMLNYCWRSSPQQWVDKGRDVVRKQFGGDEK